ncbi:hypothetical protein NHX12_027225 [Muraenolepis orangiensis]|uniref:Taperin n=1 Tax=Muraenolepis orangiensis TaxID=630683 RepID=A0A9Q0EDD2_9TELE|nr:hypothetical protein NHX12_027225 [Muraenolepis orangiensis]
MSGGDVRVLRQEAGQESPRMPAWKREILERRKAKGSGGSGGAGAAAAEASPSGSSQRVNGSEATGSDGGGPKTDNGTSRTYTITTANQHFAVKRGAHGASPDLSPLKTNKDPWASAAAAELHDTAERGGGGGPESLVQHDSLGPLQDNPFIKHEKERKRRQDRDNTTRPVQHILELYGSVPGIRTIRADNIIIIESDPDYFPEAGSKLQQNGVSSYSSLNDLLDRRGNAVTEIRAREVVIYDTTLSKSEENLSTLGRNEYDRSSYETGEGQGRVSQILKKFDSNYGKLQKKSHSTENLLDLDSSAGSCHRLRPKPQPDLVPKPYAVHPQPGSPVRNLGSTHQSSRTKPQPTATVSAKDPPSDPPPSVFSFRQRFEVSGIDVNHRDETNGSTHPPRPAKERDWEPRGPRSPTSASAASLHARHADFEIRPSPKPDLSLIPEWDLQARALANLRLQSLRSFTVIPNRHTATPPAGSVPRAAEVPRVPTAHVLPVRATPPKRQEEEEEDAAVDWSTRPSPKPTTAAVPPGLSPTCPSPPLVVSPAAPPSPVPSVPPPAVSPGPSGPDTDPGDPPPADSTIGDLPVTNIDDIEVGPQPGPSQAIQNKKGNKFRVVPKRPGDTTDSPGPPKERSSSPSSTTPTTLLHAPYHMLKKRYPAVEDIEVIGGYLSLGKSCLAKTGSTGKKTLASCITGELVVAFPHPHPTAISFNEPSLQSTYEYPSESSAWDNLSNYIPKSSVDFNAWQEHKMEEPVFLRDANAQQTQMSEEVMLTPADSASLSDYSSEPALYF